MIGKTKIIMYDKGRKGERIERSKNVRNRGRIYVRG